MGHEPKILFYNKLRLNGHYEHTSFTVLITSTISFQLDFVRSCQLGGYKILEGIFDVVIFHLRFLVH
jgi:hypothetical protein